MAKTFSVSSQYNRLVVQPGLPCSSATNLLYLTCLSKSIAREGALFVDTDAYFNQANILANGNGKRWLSRISEKSLGKSTLEAVLTPDLEQSALVLLSIGTIFGERVSCYAKHKIASVIAERQEHCLVKLAPYEEAIIRAYRRNFFSVTATEILVYYNGEDLQITVR